MVEADLNDLGNRHYFFLADSGRFFILISAPAIKSCDPF